MHLKRCVCVFKQYVHLGTCCRFLKQVCLIRVEYLVVSLDQCVWQGAHLPAGFSWCTQPATHEAPHTWQYVHIGNEPTHLEQTHLPQLSKPLSGNRESARRRPPKQRNKPLKKEKYNRQKRGKEEIQRPAEAIYAFFHLHFTFTQGCNLHFNFGGDIWELLKTTIIVWFMLTTHWIHYVTIWHSIQIGSI